MKRGFGFGSVVFLGCVLISCKLFKKDEEPAPVPTTEPAAEAAAPEDAATAAVEASTEEPTPTTTSTTTVNIKKDGGVKDGGVKDGGATADAGTTKDAGGTPTTDAGFKPPSQCVVLCQAAYTACVLSKKTDAAKCKTDRDGCLGKCK